MILGTLSVMLIKYFTFHSTFLLIKNPNPRYSLLQDHYGKGEFSSSRNAINMLPLGDVWWLTNVSALQASQPRYLHLPVLTNTVPSQGPPNLSKEVMSYI